MDFKHTKTEKVIELEFKVIRFEQQNFYANANRFNPVTVLKNAKSQFEIHLSFDNAFPIEYQKLVCQVAQTFCDLIQTKLIHHICCVWTNKNQVSVPLIILPNFHMLKQMYSTVVIDKNSENAVIKKNMIAFNFPNDPLQEYVFVVTFAQLQAFHYFGTDTNLENKTKQCVIGFDKSQENHELFKKNCFQLIMKTLGKIPAFNKSKLHYMSIASLSIFKSDGARSASSEYGSYFSFDGGKTKIYDILDDDSLEKEEEILDLKRTTDILHDILLLDMLGFEMTDLCYSQKKYTFYCNKEINEFVGNNFSNKITNLHFTIHPDLPHGCLFNNSTGKITGTPIQQKPNGIYCITALFQANITKQTLIEIEVVKEEEPFSYWDGFYTTIVLLLIVLLFLAVIFIGHKSFILLSNRS